MDTLVPSVDYKYQTVLLLVIGVIMRQLNATKTWLITFTIYRNTISSRLLYVPLILLKEYTRFLYYVSIINELFSL